MFSNEMFYCGVNPRARAYANITNEHDAGERARPPCRRADDKNARNSRESDHETRSKK